MQAHWWKDAKIYELYIDTFAGTIQNLTAQLSYFEKLGINALHILPHYPSPMVDGGYDVMDYLNVRPELGTLEDFDALITEAHARGIRIIIDFVLNHVSEFHPWFIDARTSKDSPRRDFFLWDETGNRFRESWNAFPDLKPSNWIRNDPTGDYYYATFYPQQPDLDWDNPEVFRGMIANMDFWADRGVDGFRLDAVLTLIKRDGVISKGLPETHAVIKAIRKHLDEKYGGRIALLAESHMEVEEIATFFGNGDECHMAYHFPMMEAFFQALQSGDASYIEKILTRSGRIPENCAWAFFLRNHDEISLATLSPHDRATLLPFLDPSGTYLFNSGNATAVRLGEIFNNDPEQLVRAFRLLYAMDGATIMYYGDEIGMRNLPRTEGVADTRIFVRCPFDWQEAEKQINDPNSLFHATARIIRAAHWPYTVGRAHETLQSILTSPHPASESQGAGAPSHL